MIVLFPLSYPYTIAKEETFLKKEVSEINKNFSNFFIIPLLKNEQTYCIDNCVEINLSLANYLENNFPFVSIFFNIHFYNLFLIELLSNIKSLKSIKKLILYIYNTLKIYKWIKKDFDPIVKLNEDPKKILYTYWFTHLTTALCYFYRKSKNVKIITRAHGIDLYENRNGNYIPLRKFTIKHLHRYYFVSDYARQYTIEHYPKFFKKYYTFPLGVEPHNKINILLNNNEFHFVSCSNVDHNKNVHIIFYSLKEIAIKYPNIKLRWTHFGDGLLYDDLLSKTRKIDNSNLQIELLGYQPTNFIYEFYQKSSINAFITTSLTEGGRPLSIQEALSFGIPVIASNVGGIPEVVNEKNGCLLSSQPTINELCLIIESVIFKPELWTCKREQALKTWRDMCNSEILTNNFIEELKSL